MGTEWSVPVRELRRASAPDRSIPITERFGRATCRQALCRHAVRRAGPARSSEWVKAEHRREARELVDDPADWRPAVAESSLACSAWLRELAVGGRSPRHGGLAPRVARRNEETAASGGRGALRNGRLPVVLLVPLGGEAAPRIPWAFVAMGPPAGTAARSAATRSRTSLPHHRATVCARAKTLAPTVVSTPRSNTPSARLEPIAFDFGRVLSTHPAFWAEHCAAEIAH